MNIRLASVAALLCALSCVAKADEAGLAAATIDRVRFLDPGPVSALPELKRRDEVLVKDIRENPSYPTTLNLAEESFVVRLPKGYHPSRPAPLLVWIHWDQTGAIPPAWGPAIDAGGFVVVGADKAGNSRGRWQRYQLALVAAHNAQQRYAIDPQRVYVMGVSGGGRSASWLSLHYPDVFRGGLMMAGANGYGTSKRKMARPLPEYVEYAQANCRYVFMTGEKDQNLPEMRQVRTILLADGFRGTTLLVMPGKAHDYPSDEWLRRALRALN